MTATILDKLPEDAGKFLGTLFGDVSARALMVGKKIAAGPFIGEARRPGFSVGIWNADTPAEIERYAAMGPAYLCSNYPERLVEFKQAHAMV